MHRKIDIRRKSSMPRRSSAPISGSELVRRIRAELENPSQSYTESAYQGWDAMAKAPMVELERWLRPLPHDAMVMVEDRRIGVIRRPWLVLSYLRGPSSSFLSTKTVGFPNATVWICHLNAFLNNYCVRNYHFQFLPSHLNAYRSMGLGLRLGPLGQFTTKYCWWARLSDGIRNYERSAQPQLNFIVKREWQFKT